MSVKLGELDLAASQIPPVWAGGQGTQSLGQMPGIKSACVPDGVNECEEMCAGVRVHHGWVATYNSVPMECEPVWWCVAMSGTSCLAGSSCDNASVGLYLCYSGIPVKWVCLTMTVTGCLWVYL